MIVGLFTGINGVGGVQTGARHTAAALASIAATYEWEYVFLALNDARGAHEASVAGIRFSFFGFARSKTSFALKSLRLARSKPKMIFVAHPNLVPVAATMKIVAPQSHIIAGAHGIEIWKPLPAWRRSSLLKTDLVVAPSSHTMLKLAEVQNVPQSRIRKLAWPLDPCFLEFANCPAKLTPPSGFPSGAIVLSVGRWSASERYKGADLLIRSISQLSNAFPDIQLVFVGPGDDVPRLRQEAQSQGIAKRVHFFTRVSQGELAAAYSRADIFALPSTGEGFGLVFLEAMAFGKPIVAVNAGGTPGIVEHNHNGLLVRANVADVSTALFRLLSDPALRAELGACGRLRVLTEFSFENFQTSLRNAVDELLHNPAVQLGLVAQ